VRPFCAIQEGGTCRQGLKQPKLERSSKKDQRSVFIWWAGKKSFVTAPNFLQCFGLSAYSGRGRGGGARIMNEGIRVFNMNKRIYV
jgi:hypothetical protein